MMPPSVVSLAEEVERRLESQGIALTMGGEPTYVPEDCAGTEWSITAVGPTKLTYANTLARVLIEDFLPGAVPMFSPGKLYPGETNPRWVVNLLWQRGGAPLAPARAGGRARKPTGTALASMREAVSAKLGVPGDFWWRAVDPNSPTRPIWVLPLDHDPARGGWHSDAWIAPGRAKRRLKLLAGDGPSGLRLPLGEFPPEAMRRALVLEIRDGAVRCWTAHVWVPASTTRDGRRPAVCDPNWRRRWRRCRRPSARHCCWLPGRPRPSSSIPKGAP